MKLSDRQKEALVIINEEKEAIIPNKKLRGRTVKSLENKGLIEILKAGGVRKYAKLTDAGLNEVEKIIASLSNYKPQVEDNSPRFIVQHPVVKKWYWGKNGGFVKIEDAYKFTETEWDAFKNSLKGRVSCLIMQGLYKKRYFDEKE